MLRRLFVLVLLALSSTLLSTASPAGALGTVTFTGTVTHAGAPAPLIRVSVVNDGGVVVASVFTFGTGVYTIPNVAPGGYRIQFTDPFGPYAAGAYWPDQPDLGSATRIVATGGQTVVADQQLYTPQEQPVPSYAGNSAGPTLAVIGDSITQGSTTAIMQASSGAAYVSVRGINSQRIDQLQPVADKFAATAPQQVVINAGVNDARFGHPVAQSEAAMEAMLATFAPTTCISVVTLPTETILPTLNANAVVLNSYLRSLPSTHANVHVIDWQRIRSAYQAAGEPGGKWTTDSIHLTSLGQQVYANLVRSSVDACTNPRSSLSGHVYLDDNYDVVQGLDEVALQGVSFTLRGIDALGSPVEVSTVSDASGDFVFDGLLAGTYELSEAQPVGYGPSTISIGTAGGVSTSGYVAGITLEWGHAATGYVHAQAPSGETLSGTVYVDVDDDGAPSPGDIGFPEVHVQVTGVDVLGNAVVRDVVTDATGAFAVGPLLHGTYTITDGGAFGYTAGGVTLAPAGGTPSARTVTNIVAMSGADTAGYHFGERPPRVGSNALSFSATGGIAARSVDVDDADDAYFVAGFAGTATIPSTTGPANVSTAGPHGAVLAKYGPDAGLLWTQTIAGPGYADTMDLAVDGVGNAYVVGVFTGPITFGSSAGAPSLIGSNDGFVAAFGPDGSTRWVRRISGTGTKLVTSVGIASDGSVYVSGGSTAAVTAGAESGSPATTTLAGSIDGFVGKWAFDGSFGWLRSIAPLPGRAVLPFDLVADGTGGVVVVGAHAGMDLGGGVTAVTKGGYDGFVLDIAGNSSVSWLRSFGSAATDFAIGVARDPGTGQLAVAGMFSGVVDFGSSVSMTSLGGTDAYVLVLDPSGATAWARAAGGTAPDTGMRVTMRAGHVVLAANHAGPLHVGSIAVPAGGPDDVIVASYTTSGEEEWVRSIAGSGDDGAWALTTRSDGDVLVTGTLGSSASVMPGPAGLPLAGGPNTSFLVQLRATA